jgi:hypothetical protein
MQYNDLFKFSALDLRNYSAKTNLSQHNITMIQPTALNKNKQIIHNNRIRDCTQLTQSKMLEVSAKY